MAGECDVLVVGAGPAGCSAAYFLKHSDMDNKVNVTLVDRLDPTKYALYHDMCGEAISEYLIEDINPLKPQGILEKIKSIKEYYPGGIEINTRMNGYLIDRPKFFGSITNEFVKGGGTFQEKEVIAFLQTKEKVKVKFTNDSKEYDYVVAADGANSLFRRKLGIKGETKTLLQYIVDKDPEQETLKFYYDELYEGDYKWEFPHEGNTKIGYPLIKGKMFKPEEKVLSKQARMVGFGGVDRYVDGRVLLVGDAACQTNPITKGGIRAGMVAGKIAAEAIISDDAIRYATQWNKSNFSDKAFLNTFEKLRTFGNEDLKEHIKPFENINVDQFLPKIILYLRLMYSHRKYIKIYQTYDKCDLVGW